MTRSLVLVACSLVASCSGTGSTTPGHAGSRLVVDDIFELEPNGAVTNLHWKGVDSRAGGYKVGPCILGYDAGMYQSGLEPDGLNWPEEYRYRSRPLGSRPVRWATWKRDGDAEQPGPYRVAVYVPGLQVDVACPTVADRDRAIAMLETVVITLTSRGDLASVDPARGPATWSTAPSLCTQTHAPPVGGSGDAVLVLEPGGPDSIYVGTLSTGDMVAGPTPGQRGELRAPPGTYSLDVTDGMRTVRCPAIELVAGGTTTVRVDRFRL